MITNKNTFPNSLQILLIEDNDDHSKIICRHLSSPTEKRATVHRAINLKEGLNYLSQTKVDAILADLRLPDSDLDATLSQIILAAEHTPIVVLSSMEDMDFARRKVHEGAQDYLCKADLTAELLIRSIYYAIERKHIEEERASLLMSERAAKESLRKAVEARDDFLSFASHELKTPITAIKLQLQTAERMLKHATDLQSVAEKFTKALKICNRQVNTLANLVEELLDVSRIAAGKLELHFEEWDLALLIEELSEQYSNVIAQTGGSLSCEVQPQVIGSWDRMRIEQVITNLLSNTIKHAPGVPIKITLKGDSHCAVLTCQDHGPGIPEEQHSRIFDRFERATCSKNVSGLGLGLFIVNQIVKIHGGSIAVASAPQQGSTFTITLPKRFIPVKQEGRDLVEIDLSRGVK